MDEPLYKTKITLCRIEVNIPELSIMRDIRDEGHNLKDVEEILLKHITLYENDKDDIFLFNHCQNILNSLLEEGFLDRNIVNIRKNEYLDELSQVVDYITYLINRNKSNNKSVYSIIFPDTLVIEELYKCTPSDSSSTSPWWEKPMDNILGIS